LKKKNSYLTNKHDPKIIANVFQMRNIMPEMKNFTKVLNSDMNKNATETLTRDVPSLD
jgi:hypothetical protein